MKSPLDVKASLALRLAKLGDSECHKIGLPANAVFLFLPPLTRLSVEHFTRMLDSISQLLRYIPLTIIWLCRRCGDRSSRKDLLCVCEDCL
jgi:hypothetical protein